ncbi:hypothetical protein SLS56_011425 [Neofusicoccum ribis]|uniref:Uncharacterized protein n=1 Tax=Neofusicoccum ribis TaxID=45134 RepID=A0ABR3SBN5_9PEZI
MPIDWKTQEAYQRLIAAMVAASDNNMDYKKIAYFYGQGATYDSIEGRFRIAKRMANDLKKEAEDEGRVMQPARTKSANSTPRKPKAKRDVEHATQTGRVQKSPSKKRNPAPPKLKQEPQTPSSLDSNEESEQQGATQAFEDAFAHSFAATDSFSGDFLFHHDEAV